MKKWICFLVLTLALFGSCLTAAAKHYPDVPAIHPYYPAVDFVTDYGIMEGNDLTGFQIDLFTARKEAARFLCAAANFTAVMEKNIFADILDDSMFLKDAANLAQSNILDVSECFFFRPDEFISYGEALRWMVNAAGYQQAAIEAGGYPDGYLAVGQEKKLAEHIDISDMGQWMSRGDMAQLLYNFYIHTQKDGAGGTKTSGSISKNTVWKTGETYIVTNTLTVEADVVLKIEPGVSVILLDDMIINGSLYAMGDHTNRIQIDIYNGGGIHTQKSRQNIFNYCDVWDNQTNRSFGIDSNSIIEGCRFFSMDSIVISGENQYLKNNEVICCRQGLKINSDHTVIEALTVKGCEKGIQVFTQGSDIQMKDCRILQNDIGLLAGGGAAVSDCMIENNHVGIQINEKSGYQGSVFQSQIRENRIGILNLSEPDYQIKGCNFLNNEINLENQSPYTINFQENYWGSTQISDIYQTIKDCQTYPGYGPVQIEPVLQQRYDEGWITANRNSGIFYTPFSVELSAVGAGYDIYYTQDGTDPTKNGIRYEKPITINSNVVLKTAAVKENVWGSVQRYEYTVLMEKTAYSLKNFILYDAGGRLRVFAPEGGKFTVQADLVKKDSTKTGSMHAVLAIYDNDGNLVCCDQYLWDDSETEETMTLQFAAYIPEGVRINRMKAFVWSGMDKIKPVSNVLKQVWETEG